MTSSAGPTSVDSGDDDDDSDDEDDDEDDEEAAAPPRGRMNARPRRRHVSDDDNDCDDCDDNCDDNCDDDDEDEGVAKPFARTEPPRDRRTSGDSSRSGRRESLVMINNISFFLMVGFYPSKGLED